METLKQKTLNKKNKKLVLKLMVLVIGSIVFAFSLVPLYKLICDATGLNGKTNSVADQTSSKVDASRWLKVEFTSTVMPGLGWNFYPNQTSINVHPGEVMLVTFTAKNITNEVVTGQAIPSLSPGQASPYFKKIECFCFKNQKLKAGETKIFPMRFYISPDVPGDLKTVTLSYAFYNTVK
jgi:cytochrome c oxidase assembly protein subunit 11